jgi:argininosuccinate lyase
LTLETMIDRRNCAGGTATAEVTAQIEAAEAALTQAGQG